MASAEFIYREWCAAVRSRGHTVHSKWLTAEGKRTFMAHPAVRHLTKYPEYMLLPAIKSHAKVTDVLCALEKQRQENLKRVAPAKPQNAAKTKTRRVSRRKESKPFKKSTTTFSNTFPHASTPSQSTPARPTPTLSRTFCPACGQIEEGCPCSR